MKGRRGSTIIEATMVLPLLILSILTCLMICMFFYDTTIRQCELHRALREEADALTGKTVCLSQSNDSNNDDNNDDDPESSYSITVSRNGVFKTITGKEHIEMLHQGILHSRVSEDTETLWHASDGITYVRHCTIAKHITENK